MEDVKKVIAELIKQFGIVEAGNKVTENNLMALHMKINMAIDGQITLPKVKEDVS